MQPPDPSLVINLSAIVQWVWWIAAAAGGLALAVFNFRMKKIEDDNLRLWSRLDSDRDHLDAKFAEQRTYLTNLFLRNPTGSD